MTSVKLNNSAPIKVHGLPEGGGSGSFDPFVITVKQEISAYTRQPIENQYGTVDKAENDIVDAMLAGRPIMVKLVLFSDDGEGEYLVRFMFGYANYRCYSRPNDLTVPVSAYSGDLKACVLDDAHKDNESNIVSVDAYIITFMHVGDEFVANVYFEQ